MEIIVEFPDGSKRKFPQDTTAFDVAKSISEKLARTSVAAYVNGELFDLNRNLPDKSKLIIITEDSPDGLKILRHSASHIMATAVKRIFPNTKLAIGPAIEDGFYYDFDSPKPFTETDLKNIANEMIKIVKENVPFIRLDIPKKEAIETMKKANEDYKLEILSDIKDSQVSLYKNGDFIDLCRGPHIPSTGMLKAFKLLNTTGAYWRGDERNKMLQRIYGTAFPSKKALEDYLSLLEEAKKRDHRILGKQLNLFSIHEEIGGGLIHWHPKGAIIRNIIENYWRTIHEKSGYQFVYTPHIASEEVYKISGHLENYSDLMYSPMNIEGRPFYIKPMNCPGHIMIYKTQLHSYKELPIKFAELGTVYRFERSGVLHGLLRVRGFTQDDAHIFCMPQQLLEEVIAVFNLAMNLFKKFGFTEFDIRLATKPEKAVGEEEQWNNATNSLRQALEKTGVKYQLDKGGGAFYGPKIDIKVKDCLNRLWQCTTIQFDFNLPERFDLTYVAEDGTRKRPYMIHRALLGSLERFFGILIEHYGGNFPLWLSPTQVIVLSITEKENAYAKNILEKLKAKGIRTEVDLSSNRISYKIREATGQKIPYMIIVGEAEKNENTIAIRHKEEGNIGKTNLDDFIGKLQNEIYNMQMI